MQSRNTFSRIDKRSPRHRFGFARICTRHAKQSKFQSWVDLQPFIMVDSFSSGWYKAVFSPQIQHSLLLLKIILSAICVHFTCYRTIPFIMCITELRRDFPMQQVRNAASTFFHLTPTTQHLNLTQFHLYNRETEPSDYYVTISLE